MNNDHEVIRQELAEAIVHLNAINAVLEAQVEQEPAAWPPVQFKNVAEGIEVGYDLLGGVDIRLDGKFTYVRVNYDPRYTNNAARQVLADQIVGLLTSPPPPPAADQQSDRCNCELRMENARLKAHPELVAEYNIPLYASTSKCDWVGLTDNEISKLKSDADIRSKLGDWKRYFARAIEATLKEKNKIQELVKQGYLSFSDKE